MTIQDGPEPKDYTIRELEGEERNTWYARGEAVYPDYTAYKKPRPVTVVSSRSSSPHHRPDPASGSLSGVLLTIDVGNTQTVLGLYDPDTETGDGAAVGLVDHWRISTVHERTSDEHSVLVRSMLDTIDVDFDDDLTGLSICSGVPRILANLRQMAMRYLPFEPIVIEPGVKTGMPILYDNPKEVGADRIANAIAAYDLYGGPTVVVDFGTGNNFDVISENGEFLGGDRARHRDQPRCPLWPCRPAACDRARRTPKCRRQVDGRIDPERYGLRLRGDDRRHGPSLR